MNEQELVERVWARLQRSPDPQPVQAVFASSVMDADAMQAMMRMLTILAKQGYAPRHVMETFLAICEEAKGEG